MSAGLKIALVQDALPFRGGAERMLEAVLEILPQASLYTLVYNAPAFHGTRIAARQVHTSFIDRLPGARQSHRAYLPLFPFAIEQFDFSDYDLIISFSYAVAHGVLARPGQRHICFCYTPLRYAWHQYHAAFRQGGPGAGLRSWPLRILLHYLRLWDQAAASRVDGYVAVSNWVAQLVWRAYRRPARVIYPPVEVDHFTPLSPRQDYYMVLSRLVPHKRVDLIVEAFSRSGRPLIVVGAGEEQSRLSRLASSNVQILGWQPEEKVRSLLARAKALVHAAEEEFGIALVEAQAAGCPVIAFGRGGAAETVIPGKTGLLFPDQTVESILEAVEIFENSRLLFSVDDLRWNAERFRKERFQQEVLNLIEQQSPVAVSDLLYTPQDP